MLNVGDKIVKWASNRNGPGRPSIRTVVRVTSKKAYFTAYDYVPRDYEPSDADEINRAEAFFARERAEAERRATAHADAMRIRRQDPAYRAAEILLRITSGSVDAEKIVEAVERDALIAFARACPDWAVPEAHHGRGE